MLTVFLRFIIIYFITMFSMKIMGKRQIGEMQMSELVTAFFLSELAAFPITDNRIPISFGLIPVLSLISIEVIISFLTAKIPVFKKIFDGSPSYLIDRGVLLEKELLKNRITLDELLSQLRLKDVPDISKVYYCIMEPNGKISVVLKEEELPATKKDLSIKGPEKGIARAVIDDRKLNRKALDYAQKNEKWVMNTLKKNKIDSPESVFIMTVDDSGEVFIVKKEGKK